MENTEVKPNTEKENKTAENTIPQADEKAQNSTVSVKFNKQKKEIPLDEAAILAQKGLKYELIKEDYERLKEMAKSSNKSVSDFLNEIENSKSEHRRSELLEQTGGNSELADYIIGLEKRNSNNDNGLTELTGMFPEIKEIGELPEEVIEYSEASGKSLLDSYLRYLFGKSRAEENKKENIKKAASLGIGSLKSGSLPEESPLGHEFLKGLWSR